MSVNPCQCEHEKGDHQQRLGRTGNYTPCCIRGCDCDGFRRLTLRRAALAVVVAAHDAGRPCGAEIVDQAVDRLACVLARRGPR